MGRQNFAGYQERLQPGFARDMQRRQGAATKRRMGSALPSQSVTLSRQAVEVEMVSAPRQTTLALEVGRRVMKDHNRQRWNQLEKQLGRYSHFGQATPISKLIVPFVTATETTPMLAEMYGDPELSDKERDNLIRDDVGRLNDRFEQRRSDEASLERYFVFGEEASLHIQAAYPVSEFDETDQGADTIIDIPDYESRHLKIWQAGRFAVGRVDGTTNLQQLVVRFPDTGGTLAKGRQDALNDMSDLGFNVNNVATDWSPEAVLFTTRPGVSVGNLKVSLSYPLDMPLKSPHAYEL